MNIIGLPHRTELICEDNENFDAKLSLQESDGKLKVILSAFSTKVKFIELYWKADFSDDTLVLGDAFERTYGNVCFRRIEDSESMAWYFLATDGKRKIAVGTMTGPSSFVTFTVSKNGIKAVLDVRCGGIGVDLRGRELLAAEFVSREYYCSEFEALEDFCTIMCPKPLLPNNVVYGGNNWYYAYGESSREEILKDAEYQSLLASGLENRPYMVIDDGWQIKKCAGPWIPNSRFGDMSRIADEMKEIGVRPGIWVRLLRDDVSEIPESWRLENHGGSKNMLDPSNPDVLLHVSDIVKQFVTWGYELIKHDFTTYDIIGKWGNKNEEYFADDGWSFSDKTHTTAEIFKNLYKAILDAAGDALILGCNTVSHLGAGLLHLSRIGDDTSGYDWERVYRYGVNTLAFRLAQHNRFYAVDADCVGFKGIEWEKNEQWLKLLALSGTPLFVSCPKDKLNEQEFEIMREAYKRASIQKDRLVPLDWLSTVTPTKYKLNGKEIIDLEWFQKQEENL